MTELEKSGKHKLVVWFGGVSILCMSLMNLGCGQDLADPVEPSFGKAAVQVATGALEVTVSTTGDLLDPDGYRVRVDGRQHQLIPIDGTVIYAALPVGDHTVDLKNVWGKCLVVDGNTRTVSVAEGATTYLAFAVECESAEPPPVTGALEVTTVTTGDLVDPDGYVVRVDGKARQAIGVDGTVTYSAVPVGEHVVDLKNVWGKCLVEGGNVQAATVTAGLTTYLTFEVECETEEPPPATGALKVTTITTGDILDPDGYVVRVDGRGGQPIGLNAEVTYPALTVGDHVAELRNILSGCAVEDGATRSFTVAEGAMVEVIFMVACPLNPD